MNRKLSKILLKSIYWLRKEPVWENLKEIENFLKFNINNIEEHQLKKIRSLISIAYEYIPYYRRAMSNLKIVPNDINSLEDFKKFPILTKEDIRNNYGQLCIQDNNVQGFTRRTSGSTGDPLVILKDRNSTAMMDAMMYRSYNLHGIVPGDKQLRIWGTSFGFVDKKKEQIKDFLLNRIRFSAFDLSKGKFNDIIKKIKNFKPDYIYGYAQSVYELANFILQDNVDFGDLNFKAVIVTGEMLFDWQKKIIKNAFCCSVINEYGCTEAGIIAIECQFNNMHVLSDNIFIENYSDNDDFNSKSYELLITELNNNFSPLIRYQVGDRAAICKIKCSCGNSFPVIRDLKGRSDDFIIFPSGRKVDAYVFEYILKNIPKRVGVINQFQIIQKCKDVLDIYLNTNSYLQGEIREKIIGSWFKRYGSEISIKIHFVTEIPKSPSGKLSCFKQMYYL
jgi:phenylacetate-CoA ligase